MDIKLVEEIQACLDGERTLFRYFRDQYAITLLRRLAKDQVLSVRDLRSSQWGGLLNRPALKKILSQCGKGSISLDQLEAYLHQANAEPFVLTLGHWGGTSGYGWVQTSRLGANLVLHLNLSNVWHERFRSLFGQSANDVFGYDHPLSEARPMTLAWARLDIDFETDEVLIEEIQSDLIRYVARMQLYARRAISRGDNTFSCFYGDAIPADRFLHFAKQFSERVKDIWEEAILSAVMDFVFDELGISQVYYHTFETGAQFKNIKGVRPPRSLYTELPKRFCFQSRHKAPHFLQNDRHVKNKFKRFKDCQWFYAAA